MNKILKVVMASCLSFAAVSAACAADKLQDILSANKIKIGVLSDAAPWGFQGSDGKLQGLDIDLANLMAKDLGVKLEIVQVTGASRIPSLLSNKVDILIAAAGATPARALQVMFSQPYAAVDLGVYGGSGMKASKDVAALDGQTVAVAKGSTLDVWLTDNAKGVKVMRFEDTPAAIKAFLSGQAAAFAENSAISKKVNDDNPSANVGLKFLIRQSPAHIMVGQGDQNLLNWINTFLFTKRMSGELSQLQTTWFGSAQDLPLM